MGIMQLIQHNTTPNKLFLHVRNHALKIFLIEIFTDFINYGIHFLIITSFQE